MVSFSFFSLFAAGRESSHCMCTEPDQLIEHLSWQPELSFKWDVSHSVACHKPVGLHAVIGPLGLWFQQGRELATFSQNPLT